MLQLQPKETFYIKRLLEDHTDSTTYYVRAVIKYASDRTVIETVNLTDRGSRLFDYDWEVIPDPSGQGIFITIETSVYTDSGYTTKAAKYGDEIEVYLVQQRYNYAMGGGGGGVDISYGKIEDIMKKAVEAIKIPEQQKISLKSLENGLGRLERVINAIYIPEPEKIDYSPILSEIQAVKQAIKDIYIPEPEKVNLAPIIQSNTAENQRLEGVIRDLLGMFNELIKSESAKTNQFIKDFKIKHDLTGKMRKLFSEYEPEFSEVEQPKRQPRRPFLSRLKQ